MLTVHPGRSYFENLALRKPTTQFEKYHKSRASSKAVDGNSNLVLGKDSCAQTYVPTKWYHRSWWQVDLQAIYAIREIVITSTRDPSGTFLVVSSY